MNRFMMLWVGLLMLPACLAMGADHPIAPSTRLEPLVHLLATADEPDIQRDVLRGMVEGLQGRRRVSAPRCWPEVSRRLGTSPSSEIREQVLLLSVVFGDPEAVTALRKTAANPRAEEAARRQALQTLIETRVNDLLPLLSDLLADPGMRRPALRALAIIQDPAIPSLILKRYGSWNDAEKADAVATLASRPESALALLEAMEREQVSRRDLSPFVVRQLLGFKNPTLTARLTKVWGTIRQPSQEKATLLPRYLGLVAPAALQKADRGRGRLVFARACASCHTLFDDGGKIGPELTGSQRANPEYILTKVLDPNAVVGRDYQMTVFTIVDGRTINGLIKEENDKTVTIQTQNEIIRLPKLDIEERRRSETSLMPEGLLSPWSDLEVRDLFAYLAGPGQVPLPAQPGGKLAPEAPPPARP